MPNKVAIIGSDSFLAKYLVKELLADHSITGYSRSNTSNLESHTFFDFPEKSIEFERLLDFDQIIYCAGSGIQAGQRDDFVFQLNTFLPVEIALFLNQNDFKGKFVTFGSYAEIGNNAEAKRFTEEELITSLLAAPNNYCVSKRLLSRFFHSVSLNINFYHLILPTIYGKGENPNRLVPYLVSCLTNGQTPKLTGGTQTRQYVHVSDTAKLIKTLLKSENIKSGIYNVPSYETCLVKDIVASIYKKLEADDSLIPEILERYDETMKFLALDPTKMTTLFPLCVPRISVLDSIEEYLANH